MEHPVHTIHTTSPRNETNQVDIPIKIVAIGGQTASGKSQLAIDIAQKFNGEIINADSRQLYRYMDIGTAKEKASEILSGNIHVIQGVKHHLIDIAEPDKPLNLQQYQKLAIAKVHEIHALGKLPIIVGGTGLYLDSILHNYSLTNEEINHELRKELQENDVTGLQEILEQEAPETFNKMNDSDKLNPHRLIRAIEKSRSHVDSKQQSSAPRFGYLYLAIDIPLEELEVRIQKRVDDMFTNGLVEENEKLIKMGYTTKLSPLKSIGYQEFDDYFAGNLTLEEIRSLIILRTRQYAKRQKTWFKRNPEIHWINNSTEAFQLVQQFLG